jgi:hypothetical protein
LFAAGAAVVFAAAGAAFAAGAAGAAAFGWVLVSFLFAICMYISENRTHIYNVTVDFVVKMMCQLSIEEHAKDNNEELRAVKLNN